MSFELWSSWLACVLAVLLLIVAWDAPPRYSPGVSPVATTLASPAAR